jgi:ribonuclease P protein component
MLDRAHRLTSGTLFATAVRRGRRAGSTTLVVHLADGDSAEGAPPRVGLVVGRSIGNAVARNQVKRRLRHLARERLESLPDDAVLVIRALPAAAGVSSTALGDDLDRALARLVQTSSRT